MVLEVLKQYNFFDVAEILEAAVFCHETDEGLALLDVVEGSEQVFVEQECGHGCADWKGAARINKGRVDLAYPVLGEV